MNEATASLSDSQCKVRIGDRLSFRSIPNTGFTGIVCKDCSEFFSNFEAWFSHLPIEERDKTKHVNKKGD